MSEAIISDQTYAYAVGIALLSLFGWWVRRAASERQKATETLTKILQTNYNDVVARVRRLEDDITEERSERLNDERERNDRLLRVMGRIADAWEGRACLVGQKSATESTDIIQSNSPALQKKKANKLAASAALMVSLAFFGCGTRTTEVEVEREVGVVEGKHTDVTRTRKLEAKTEVDIVAEIGVLKSLVSGLRGDLPGAVAALVPRPDPVPNPQEIGKEVAAMLPNKNEGTLDKGGLGAAGLALLWALREYMSKRTYKKLVLSKKGKA